MALYLALDEGLEPAWLDRNSLSVEGPGAFSVMIPVHMYNVQT